MSPYSPHRDLAPATPSLVSSTSTPAQNVKIRQSPSVVASAGRMNVTPGSAAAMRQHKTGQRQPAFAQIRQSPAVSRYPAYSESSEDSDPGMEEVIEYDDYSHTMSRSRTYEDYSRTMSGVCPGSTRAARLSDVIYDRFGDRGWADAFFKLLQHCHHNCYYTFRALRFLRPFYFVVNVVTMCVSNAT